MINSWHTRAGCVSKAWKPPSSRPILIYFEFRSKPSRITVICMDPHSPNKLFATKYCFLTLGDEFLFLNHFFIFRFFFLFYVILLLLIFTKTMLLLAFYLINFFLMKITFIFHVPECCGMCRNVPCSWFYRRPERNACFNLERLSRSFRLAWPGISPLERLWNGFDSDDELFTYRT